MPLLFPPAGRTISQPTVGDVGNELYAAVSPLAYDDENQGFALLAFCAALAYAFETPAAWARPTADGKPGWSLLVDLDRAPAEVLPWLAQIAGVQLQSGLSDSAQRDRIRSTDGQRRGTRGAIVGAAQQYLTGTKTVILVERDGSPYRLTMHTFADETPDSSKVLAALTAQKPAGLVLTYSTISHWNFEIVRTGYASFNALTAAFSDFNHLRDDAP